MRKIDWTTIAEQLRHQGLYLTAPRKRVIEAVLKARRPVTIAELERQLGRRRPHRTTLYRTLESLAAAGILKQVNFRHEQSDRYEAGDRLHRHHHHIVCESCGDTETVVGCTSQNLPAQFPKRFKVLGHQLEFYGLCARCQGSAA